MWPKFGKSSVFMREVIMTLILRGGLGSKGPLREMSIK